MNDSSLVANAADFRAQLIDWYDQSARDLPWRSHPSLYKTVVSEFMLQQTQVKTVLPYFHNWLQVFPGFEALASASEEAVVKHWEGLGYYSRARNLHKLARIISDLDSIPTDAKSWLALPGIGPYAAAAVCSIAFSDPSAVVDGNVVRILSRLVADRSEYKTTTDAAKTYQSLATALLNHARPGDHNQAMMELGATLCQNQKPQCLLCPVQSLCQARAQGIETKIPRFNKTKAVKQTVERAWIVSPKGVLLYRIPQTASRMKGLHEIPSLEVLNLKTPKTSPLIVRQRSITKYRITERFHEISAEKTFNGDLPDHFLWANPDSIASLTFTGPHRKWITELIDIVSEKQQGSKTHANSPPSTKNFLNFRGSSNRKER